MSKTLRSSGLASVLSLIALVPLWQAGSSLAQVAAAPMVDRVSTTQVSVTSVASAAAASGGTPAISFSGQATVKSRLSKDPEFGRSVLVLMIGLDGVTGLDAGTGKRYALSGSEVMIKPHAANQIVEFNFPIPAATDAALSSLRTGVARFAFNVDVASGAITSASASLSAP
jgi:hypothetical protein